MVLKNKSIRKLTPEECIKFQGFPKSFKFSPKVPISQRYKQAGNSVVVPFIKKIATQIKNALS
jgi:DNA (cytosine-5)-methyltransferase 1